MKNNLLIKGRPINDPSKPIVYSSTQTFINPAIRSFDGLAISEFNVSVDLFSKKDVEEMIDILTVLKYCFPNPKQQG